MLELKSIKKDYVIGSNVVHALRGIDLKFRESEFVSVLGPSGCGKTTLLNIIGGLDRFTEGDLIINGKSTKKFKDRDWDAYRNNSIGFVFQTYNLISHQSVIANVEMALTLSGVSKSERRERAINVLEQVGLGDQIYKKPNQLSGGQMQRVAIARALINDPDVLLADEPTGALDTETSVQIMDLLTEIAKGKLVIMVTHNSDLAEKYSSRIIKLLDGKVISDSRPVEDAEDTSSGFSFKRTAMNFFTALALSVSNLMTKKTRTLLTAFAGSIGIIGIALILSLSNGLQTYIDNVERDTLSAYPIIIEKQAMDISGIMESMGPPEGSFTDRVLDKIYVNPRMARLMNTLKNTVKDNNLTAFKSYIEENEEKLKTFTTAVSYGYDIDLNLYHYTYENEWFQVNPSKMFIEMYSAMYGIDISTMDSSSAMSGFSSSVFSNADQWKQLIPNTEFLQGQYELLDGKLPEGAFEAALVVGENNNIPDLMLYSLGLRGQGDLDELIKAVLSTEGATLDAQGSEYSYDDILGLEYAVITESDFYIEMPDGTWVDARASGNTEYIASICESAPKVKIVAILRPSEDAAAVSTDTLIGYTEELEEYLVQHTLESKIVNAQIDNPETDVFSGKSFDEVSDAPQITLDQYLATLDAANTQLHSFVEAQRAQGVSDEAILELLQQYISSGSSSTSTTTATAATYEANLEKLQYRTFDNPKTIEIFASSFENKDLVEEFISDFNATQPEGQGLTYTDYIGLLLSSVTTVINAISMILIAFVSISLVVSSIMIGIITYISVLERTKEIGILRAIGASKKDIARVFNAETLFIGFAAGFIGILITVLLCIPANIIIRHYTGLTVDIAVLPWIGAAALILVSCFLTFVAGLIPSRVASRKDPVVALRTE